MKNSRYTSISRKRKVVIFILALLLIVGILVWRQRRATAPGVLSTTNGTQQTADRPIPEPGFNKSQYPLDSAGSIWWVVNKNRPLSPLQYAPDDLVQPNIAIRPNAGNDERLVRKVVAEALESMSLGAKKDGANLMLASGYRSYQTQVAVYNNEVKQYGQAVADTESARPGRSEHQTGLAADLEDAGRTCEVADCFANTTEGKWLATHAHEYGFIIRYLNGKDASTGYRYEPWHVRYVGKDLANELYNAGQTMEEFFNL